MEKPPRAPKVRKGWAFRKAEDQGLDKSSPKRRDQFGRENLPPWGSTPRRGEKHPRTPSHPPQTYSTLKSQIEATAPQNAYAPLNTPTRPPKAPSPRAQTPQAPTHKWAPKETLKLNIKEYNTAPPRRSPR